MPEQAVLVIDAGTSSIRCHLFDERGVEMAAEQAFWPPSIAPAELPLAREFRPDSVLSGVHGLIRRIIDRVDVEVGAVAVTSMRQGIAILDHDGQAVYLGPNVDLRAVFEGAAIDEAHRELVYETTGHLPSFFFAPAKLVWLRDNRPRLFDRIRTAVTIPDWIIFQITGLLASEPTLAGEAGLLDITSRRWATRLAETLNVPLDDSVPMVEAGRVVGGINRRTAQETGIAVRTPVVSAGADTQCAALGMGATEPGQVAVVAGWSAPVQQVTELPMPSARGATWVGCHLAGRRWVAESSAWDAGRAYSWIAETTGRSFEELELAAEAAGPGAEGTIAVLGHPRMDMSSVGLRCGGMVFPVPVTMNERGPGHLARAALESVCYSIKANLEQLGDVTGRPAESIALGGGLARSSLFGHVLANVLDADILVLSHKSASAAGAFLCAKLALTGCDSPSQVSNRSAADMVRIPPDALLASEYQDHYSRWLQASSALASVQV